MRLGQHMKLAPRMIQSMEILQMPLMQLEERIAQELESNVALETLEADPGADDGLETHHPRDSNADETLERPIEVGDRSARDDFERLENFEAEHPDATENEYSAAPEAAAHDLPRRDELLGAHSAARQAGERDGKMDAMANAAERSISLPEQLLRQWRLADVDDRTRLIGEHLIGYIEEDGYLRTPLDAIADRLPQSIERPTLDELQRTLRLVQLLLDPPGTGARDVKECLLLQLDALEEEHPDEKWAAVRTLIEQHLDDMAQNRLPRIAERTGMTLQQVKDAMEAMRILQLAPARSLVAAEPSILIPDAIVEYDAEEDRYIAYLNDRRLPNLQLNREYALMARDRQVPRQTRDFLKTNLSNAQWLIDAVDQRRRTLLRVIRVVVDAQRDYFDYGPQSRRPLPMTQVAEQLGIHVATVSRAVADKWLETPRGVVPLRGFFSGGTQTESGEEVSWDAVKAALKEVIDAEDKSNPLSDDALAEELKNRGIEIARRTVAKYRGQMNIPSARLRKEY
jgi:RNA polymerase sigma-54 factor